MNLWNVSKVLRLNLKWSGGAKQLQWVEGWGQWPNLGGFYSYSRVGGGQTPNVNKLTATIKEKYHKILIKVFSYNFGTCQREQSLLESDGKLFLFFELDTLKNISE